MKSKVIIPPHLKTASYFWYVYRCLYKLAQVGKIELEINNEPKPIDWNRYAASIYIDGKPLVIDLCDSSCFAIWELEKHPLGTKILKTNYSQVLWNNPPESFEHKLPEEQKKYIPFAIPFVFGRSLSLDFDINEKAHYAKSISPINKEIVSLSGEGKYAQQTENRLKIYELITSVFSKERYELLWNNREHFQDVDKISNYIQRKSPYAKPNISLFGCYENYIKWLSTGKYSLNTPGISASQPFRLVDAVLSQRKIISTPMWIESCQDYPTIIIPTEGYFSYVDDKHLEEQSKQILQNLSLYDYDLEDANKWYKKYLSISGMWTQLLKGVA